LNSYQDIWPFHHKSAATLRMMKDNFNLHGETIHRTPLLNVMFSDFDNLHKQLPIRQKNGNIKGKKQEVFNIVQVISEDEAKKVFHVLLSTKQKLKSNETDPSYE
jgi:hypothetical protein